jgi:hypothetical protein
MMDKYFIGEIDSSSVPATRTYVAPQQPAYNQDKIMMILHVFRVYLTGGFKKPRELTWVTGVLISSLFSYTIFFIHHGKISLL